MRGLLIPTTGEVVVVEETGPWPPNDIQEFLNVDPMHTLEYPVRGPLGRTFVTYSARSVSDVGMGLLHRRPTLILAWDSPVGNRPGVPASLSKFELMFLGFIVGLEEFGIVLPTQKGIE